MRLYNQAIQMRRQSITEYASAEGSRISVMAQHVQSRSSARVRDLEMSLAAANSDLQLGMILDADNVVRYATSQQYRGLRIEDTPLNKYSPLVKEVKDAMTGRVVDSANRQQLVGIYPFGDGMAHGKGCVLLEYDLKGPLTLASAVARRASLAQSLVLVGGCIALWILLEILVTRRVSVLVDQVQRMSTNGAPMQILPGTDEISQVSQAIHDIHQRLQSSELRFRQITTAMRDIFWLAPATPDQVPFANAAYREFLGRDEKKLLTRRWDWLRAIAREDRHRCLDFLRSLRHNQKTEELELRVNVWGGKVRWIRCRGFAMVDEPNKMYSVAGIAMDVTERKMLERRLLDATEKERRSIGMDLHEDLCQRLAAALMKTGVLQSVLASGGGRQATLASDIVSDLSDATGVARGYARGLAPVGIETLGLSVALSDLGEYITKDFRIPCRVECNTPGDVLDGECATHIFRVAQGLAVGAAKHANPTWIEIGCETNKKNVRLVITHNGNPYRPNALNGEGMGMHLVRQRLDALTASISFHQELEDNPFVSVECLIPLRQTIET